MSGSWISRVREGRRLPIGDLRMPMQWSEAGLFPLDKDLGFAPAKIRLGVLQQGLDL